MYKKKSVLTVFSLLLTLSVFTFLNPITNAEMQIPELNKGQYWTYTTNDYNYTIPGKTFRAHSETTIEKDTEYISVNDKTYHVWKFVTKIEGINKVAIRQIHYYNYTDLALVKAKQNVTRSIYGFNYTYNLYNPISYWPLKTGNKITYNTTVERIFDNYQETKTKTKIAHCLDIEKVETEIGTLSCYKIIFYNLEDKNEDYTINYFSPEIGWMAKMEIYKDGELVQSAVLESYHGEINNSEKNNNQKKDKQNLDLKIILIALLIFLITIILFIFYKYQKRKK